MGIRQGATREKVGQNAQFTIAGMEKDVLKNEKAAES